MNDLVSIIMPSYNTAKYIGESIQSVLAQTYTNWELIIVDDCSTDNTDEVVASIKDSRIRYLKNDKNSGAAVSRNRALREARGRWIAFLDSDDLWLPSKLESQIRLLGEHDDAAVAFSYYEKISEQGERAGRIIKSPAQVTYRQLLRGNVIGCLTGVYDAEKVGRIMLKKIKNLFSLGVIHLLGKSTKILLTLYRILLN